MKLMLTLRSAACKNGRTEERRDSALADRLTSTSDTEVHTAQPISIRGVAHWAPLSIRMQTPLGTRIAEYRWQTRRPIVAIGMLLVVLVGCDMSAEPQQKVGAEDTTLSEGIAEQRVNMTADAAPLRPRAPNIFVPGLHDVGEDLNRLEILETMDLTLEFGQESLMRSDKVIIIPFEEHRAETPVTLAE